MIFNALLFAIFYAAYDRTIGAGKFGPISRGKATGIFALVGALDSYFTLGWPMVAVVAVFVVWRTPAWKVIPGGSSTPRGAKQILVTFVRHALPTAAGAFIISKAFALPLQQMMIPYAAFAVIATALGAWYAQLVDHARVGDDMKRQNAAVEIVRGAAFGVASVLAVAW
jgi:hypothetical protein